MPLFKNIVVYRVGPGGRHLRSSFVLTEQLGIRKIDIRGVESTTKGEDGFDADVAIATGELSLLLPELIGSLGGEPAQQQGIERIDVMAHHPVA